MLLLTEYGSLCSMIFKSGERLDPALAVDQNDFTQIRVVSKDMTFKIRIIFYNITGEFHYVFVKLVDNSLLLRVYNSL